MKGDSRPQGSRMAPHSPNTIGKSFLVKVVQRGAESTKFRGRSGQRSRNLRAVSRNLPLTESQAPHESGLQP